LTQRTEAEINLFGGQACRGWFNYIIPIMRIVKEQDLINLTHPTRNTSLVFLRQLG